MLKIFHSNKVDILQKAQENLEQTQENNKLITTLLNELVSSKSPTEKSVPRSDEEKRKAAYALNLCTVSVSQIIDYNDLRLLESEYDAILNNLNLEEMPKDEALLKILKQLLDVITFFRIQEGDREMMEKEYAQRMKDAIWSAVPNPSVIVTSGNPIAIAISLASQVGIGYMNYRKEKAKIGLDKERKEWELQRSAMEQFNGLRRELFDTAWRLADEYRFPDKYRITERQISQFNRILMDTDDLRRYERLEYIQDKFEAYPPFWYYLGNAANLVYQNENYDDNLRGEYKNRAIVHFNEFLQITEQNLLREDQLTASCALEKFDLIEDKNEQLQLLDRAAKASGNAFDVLQICAVSYLKIGEIQKSCELLRMLVNENYNETLNAQLLSKFYVSQMISGDDSVKEKFEAKYKTLASRVSNPENLFPMPRSEHGENLEEQFLTDQRNNLLLRYADGLIHYVSQCEKEYSRLCTLDGNITSEMAEFVKEIASSVEELLDIHGSTVFLDKLKSKMDENKAFMKMLELGDERNRGKYSVQFGDIFGDAFTFVAEELRMYLSSLPDMDMISVAETGLTEFLLAKNIDISSYVALDTYNGTDSSDAVEEIFGEDFKNNLERRKQVESCIQLLKEKGYTKDKIVSDDRKIDFIYRGDPKFMPYLKKEKNQKKYRRWVRDDEIIAILKDEHWWVDDLIFTPQAVYRTIGWGMIDKAFYKDVKWDKGGEHLKIRDSSVLNNINQRELKEMIDLLAKKSNAANGEASLAEKVRMTILNGSQDEN